jgi:hypothetical protein
MPAKKKAAAKKSTAKRSTTKKAVASAAARPARPGDRIVIDSTKVGSPPREGEVLEVIRGEVSVSYRVAWADGRQTLIAPKLGNARVVPAGRSTR